jgi:ssDNA-binding Zn-finger/Zn-ribbon topoisomerase 1
VPLLREFYAPLRTLVDEKRKELRRKDFTTEATDEVCSLGHPMVIRLGRNGRFLACSLYPEHKESRPLPGEEPDLPALPGAGEPCPTCGEADGGVLAVKRGRFGPFVGCNRYPDCSYIRKDGPPPPDQLPFEVACPRCGEGHLVARRARRTGSVFWGCSRYPTCDFTTSHEPLGPVHDVDGGPVARRDDETGLCLKCGASVPLPGGVVPAPGAMLAGGPPDPAALARPGGRGGRRPGGAAGRGRTAPAGGAAPRHAAATGATRRRPATTGRPARRPASGTD